MYNLPKLNPIILSLTLYSTNINKETVYFPILKCSSTYLLNSYGIDYNLSKYLIHVLCIEKKYDGEF